MAACMQLNIKSIRPRSYLNPASKHSLKICRIRCAATTTPQSKWYSISLLPDDGIDPEVMSVAKKVLLLAGSFEGIEFNFQEMPMGGAALDLVGVPLPEETLSMCKQSDAVLLGAIGGYKWDNNEKHLKPETGLLQIRAGLKVFANLRPATVFPQLVDASTLKKEVAEDVDIMVVRELTGGIYFGKPSGFGTNQDGEEFGFNTEQYDANEVDRIAHVAFETARKRHGKLCFVDKANVLEASMLWRKRVIAIAKDYPDVELSHMYVDNAATQLHKHAISTVHSRRAQAVVFFLDPAKRALGIAEDASNHSSLDSSVSAAVPLASTSQFHSRHVSIPSNHKNSSDPNCFSQLPRNSQPTSTTASNFVILSFFKEAIFSRELPSSS